MDSVLAFKAVIMGLVEGLTEFLPISSTGHLILAGSLIDFDDARAKLFDVVIQFGAILAVVWEFRGKLANTLRGLFAAGKADGGGDALAEQQRSRRFALHVVIACLPAVIAGVLFADTIKAHLFAPVPVALAAIIGGFVILWVERIQRRDARQGDRVKPQVTSLDLLTWRDALKVGLAQCLALIPGTSRSGATIIGGMLFGLERKVATEFSFFLAIPIIFGASVYELIKHRHGLDMDAVGLLAIGALAAFAAAIVCVRWLLRFIARHDFTVFAWYRIAFGVVILVAAYGFGEWQVAAA